MKALLPAVALAALLPLAGTAEARALHAVGLDMVRLLDKGQFEPDDGTLNLFYQGWLSDNTGWTLGYAWGEQSSIPEIGYKVYNQAYQAGTYWQIGLATVDVEGTDYNHDLAVWGSFGFERSPVANVVISGSAKAMVGIDHPRTGEKDIIFLPTLSVMFTF